MRRARGLLLLLGVALSLQCGGSTSSTDAASSVDMAQEPDFALDRPCGGMTGMTCPMGMFCERGVGQCVGDGPGTCRVIPASCGTEMNPVCGCDDMTYANDCERRKAGMSAGQAGACP